MFGITFRDKTEIDFNQIPNRELQIWFSYNQNPNNTKQKKFSVPFKFT